jgi:mannosyltransferase OCH1-like enzyme
MPAAYVEFAAGWQRLHPDWEYRLWGGDDLPPLRNRDLYDVADYLFGDLAHQFRSDLVRYELLDQFGGVWVDTDFECLKPLDSLLEGVECFAAWVTTEWLNNALIGAEAGHPFIRRLIDGLPDSIARNPGKAPRVVSGPQYLTHQWRKDGAGVTTFDRSRFYPYLWSELRRGHDRFPGAWAVHHWHNRRRERGQPL